MPSPGSSLFNDGERYERSMGVWSRMVGNAFIDWLRPPPGLRWIDIGCGSGAFTELLTQRCSPREILGIDPSEAQLSFARTRLAAAPAAFQQGDAMALPCEADRFDAAVMALVIFFVPDPARSVNEMVRAVRPGGLVAAYVWDTPAGGSPSAPIVDELQKMQIEVADMPPSAHVSRIEALHDLWSGAGMADVRTHTIAVQRSFADFDEFWTTMSWLVSVRRAIAAMSPAGVATLKDRLRSRLGVTGNGSVRYEARANAVTGRVVS